MTYKQLFEKIEKQAAEKTNLYLKMVKNVSLQEELKEYSDFDKCSKIKFEWQVATNEYLNFRSLVILNNINPDDVLFNLSPDDILSSRKI